MYLNYFLYKDPHPSAINQIDIFYIHIDFNYI